MLSMNFSGSAKEDLVFEAAAAIASPEAKNDRFSPRRDCRSSVTRCLPGDSAGSEGRRVVRLECDLRKSPQRNHERSANGSTHHMRLQRSGMPNPIRKKLHGLSCEPASRPDAAASTMPAASDAVRRNSGLGAAERSCGHCGSGFSSPDLLLDEFDADLAASGLDGVRSLIVRFGHTGSVDDRLSAAVSLAKIICDASVWNLFRESELFALMLSGVKDALELDHRLLVSVCCFLIHLSCRSDASIVRRLTAASVSIVVRAAQACMHQRDMDAPSQAELCVRMELECLLEPPVVGETAALCTLVRIVEQSVPCRALLRSNGGLFVCASGIGLYDSSCISGKQLVLCLRVLEICVAGSQANQSYVADAFVDLPNRMCSILEAEVSAAFGRRHDAPLHAGTVSRQRTACIILSQVARCACNLCNSNAGACSGYSIENLATILHVLAIVSRSFLSVIGSNDGAEAHAIGSSTAGSVLPIAIAESGSIWEESVLLVLLCWLVNLAEVSARLAEWFPLVRIAGTDLFESMIPGHGGDSLTGLEFLVGLFRVLNARCDLDHESDRRLGDTILAAHSALLIAFAVRDNLYSMETLVRCMPGGQLFPLANMLLEFVGMQAASEGMGRDKIQAFTTAIDVFSGH